MLSQRFSSSGEAEDALIARSQLPRGTVIKNTKSFCLGFGIKLLYKGSRPVRGAWHELAGLRIPCKLGLEFTKGWKLAQHDMMISTE